MLQKADLGLRCVGDVRAEVTTMSQGSNSVRIEYRFPLSFLW